MSQCLVQQPWARMTHMVVPVACAVARCSFREIPHQGPCTMVVVVVVVRNNADDQGQPIHGSLVAGSAQRVVCISAAYHESDYGLVTRRRVRSKVQHSRCHVS